MYFATHLDKVVKFPKFSNKFVSIWDIFLKYSCLLEIVCFSFKIIHFCPFYTPELCPFKPQFILPPEFIILLLRSVKICVFVVAVVISQLQAGMNGGWK